MCTIPKIVERNKDIEHVMHASSNYGSFYQGKRKNKLFSMLVTTDIHECPVQLGAAVDYLNHYDAIDCGICLGDVQQSNFEKTDGTWYYNAISHTKKPFMTVIGNHDVGNSRDPKISGSSQEAYEKFIRPTDSLSGIEGRDAPYFVKLFDEFKIAIVGLDLYGDPSEIGEDGNYRILRGMITITQRQVDWFCKTLSEIPEGYNLIVAMHTFPYDADVTECAWSQKESKIFYPQEAPYGDDNMLTDIVDAWVRGDRLCADYAPQETRYLPTLHVECDFTARGEGIFATYAVGHHHKDIQGKCKKYPYQNVIVFPSTANDGWQNYCSDLPREKGTRAEDAITVMSVATDKRQIRLVRVGSNITMDMVERKYCVIDY